MKKRITIPIGLTITLCIFILLSITTIYSAEELLKGPSTLAFKQSVIYFIGVITMILLFRFDYENLLEASWVFYGLGILSLILVLFFGKTINNTRCWFVIPYLGNIQPSEFMKIFLILFLSQVTMKFMKNKREHTLKEEFFFLCKVLFIVLIPSILTFLEPDTGAVFMYFLIAFTILLISGLRYRWFLLGALLILGCAGIFFGLYFFQKEVFVELFGTTFFYRMDRILNWQDGSGMQLENALMAIGSAKLFGHGFRNTPIYFPEPQTDFIFAVFTSNYGFLGAIMLLLLFLYFDLTIINIAIKSNKVVDKLLIAGFMGMLLYQQVQNIGMTLGLLPITGITLPFISYGGSSLLSYMILLGIIFQIAYKHLKYTN